MDEAELLEHLTTHLSILFTKDEGEEARHLLSLSGIDEVLTAKDLATKICGLEKDKKDGLLEKTGMTGVSDDRLEKQLQKRFPYLFPKSIEGKDSQQLPPAKTSG
jgi:hypothetical protein